ncbi:MAG: hypothetical protein K9K65_04720, partial [Desulfarculaceae bacterium]|nr:hypothetical protein [Desulfarculaceae bacterium]
KGVVVLADTNRPDIMDTAVLRPGRFDEVVEMGSPGAEDREAIFAVHLAGKPLASGISARWLAAQSDGFSGAEIASVCNLAALRGVSRAVAEAGHSAGEDTKVEVTLDDLRHALDIVMDRR